MEYKVLTAVPQRKLFSFDIDAAGAELGAAVQQAMADGWQCQGGIASTISPNGIAVWMQAMVRP